MAKQPVGRVALFDKDQGDFSFSNFTASLRVIDPHELDFRFLHKFLHWTYVSGVTERMQSHSTGIRNLDGDAYKAIKITFPPLPKQRRIVAILDQAFEGIGTAKANAEKNLKNARALFENYRHSIFSQRHRGWVEKPLGEVCEYVNGKAHEQCIAEDGRFIVINSKFISSEGEISRDQTRRSCYFNQATLRWSSAMFRMEKRWPEAFFCRGSEYIHFESANLLDPIAEIPYQIPVLSAQSE